MDPVTMIMLANAAVKLGIEVYNAVKDDPRVPAEALAEMKANLARLADDVSTYTPKGV